MVDEKAYANAKEKTILLIYEKCISENFKKGIQGSFEYLEFEREKLDELFLEAIPAIRNLYDRILETKGYYDWIIELKNKTCKK